VTANEEDETAAEVDVEGENDTENSPLKSKVTSRKRQEGYVGDSDEAGGDEDESSQPPDNTGDGDGDGPDDSEGIDNALEDDDDEANVRVVGRRRRALGELHDPVRVRRRKLNVYYARGE
jgi:hypothetical protein